MEFEQFRVYLWAYIPDTVISIQDRNVDNRDFWDTICFDAYRIYEQSSMNIDLTCKFVESMLFAVKRHKPYF